MELNKYSKTITQDQTQPAAQAMLYGIGLTEEDLKKAQVGIVSMGYDGNTCNMHLNDLAKDVKKVFGMQILSDLFLIPLVSVTEFLTELKVCVIHWFLEM